MVVVILGVADPGSGGTWEWRTLEVADPWGGGRQPKETCITKTK